MLGLLLVPLAFTLARRVSRYERERQSMIRIAVEASSAERRRVAGELHDGVIQDLAGVGYALSSIDMQLVTFGTSNGERTAGDPEPALPIDRMLTTLHTAQRLVHDDLLALRELTGLQYAADSPAVDPEAALRVVADHVAAEGTPVELVVGPLPELPAAHRAALIRIGREAMRNAAKHAPGSHVALTLVVVRRHRRADGRRRRTGLRSAQRGRASGRPHRPGAAGGCRRGRRGSAGRALPARSRDRDQGDDPTAQRLTVYARRPRGLASTVTQP